MENGAISNNILSITNNIAYFHVALTTSEKKIA